MWDPIWEDQRRESLIQFFVDEQGCGLKIYWAWPRPTEQDPVSPSVRLCHQEVSISLLSFPIRGQTEWKPQSQKLIKLITWTTALSNSMKLWTMPCRATQERRVMVESSDKTWSPGEGNGKPHQHSCLEYPMNSTGNDWVTEEQK